MLVYLKFILVWLLFMGIIAAATVLVPKLAAKWDKYREKRGRIKAEKPFSLKQSTYMTPISEDELNETSCEGNNNDA